MQKTKLGTLIVLASCVTIIGSGCGLSSMSSTTRKSSSSNTSANPSPTVQLSEAPTTPVASPTALVPNDAYGASLSKQLATSIKQKIVSQTAELPTDLQVTCPSTIVGEKGALIPCPTLLYGKKTVSYIKLGQKVSPSESVYFLSYQIDKVGLVVKKTAMENYLRIQAKTTKAVCNMSEIKEINTSQEEKITCFAEGKAYDGSTKTNKWELEFTGYSIFAQQSY